MIKIEAIVREEKLNDVIDALAAINVHGITCYQVMGCGAQHGIKSYVRGHQEVELFLLPKIKVEVVIAKETCEEKVVEAIQKAAFTGQQGDGKIFSYDCKSAVRIRTGESGFDAIQPNE